MHGLNRWMGWTLVVALAVPVFAADEKKDEKKKKKADAAKAKKKADDVVEPKAKPEKVVYGQTFAGTLTRIAGNSQKDFAVQITYRYQAINQGALNSLAQIQQQQRQAMLNRNPIQRRQQLAQISQQMQQAMQNLYQIKEKKVDVELRAADEMKIRTAHPPVEYDDKGNLKKYTAKELKALKGPGNLPGYPGDWESLRAYQVVRVYLAKKKFIPKKKAKKKDDVLDDDDDDLGNAKPEVVMVVVLRDPPDIK
jgi:hypothetical protein